MYPGSSLYTISLAYCTVLLISQVRFLVLKNLAAVLAEDDSTAADALKLYGEAAQLDNGDIVLWNRMGTLVR